MPSICLQRITVGLGRGSSVAMNWGAGHEGHPAFGGHPLGLMSTGKKVFVPNMFFIGLAHYCPESPVRSALSEPVTSSFDSGR